VHSKLTRPADITLELVGDVYDENQPSHIHYIFCFCFFALGAIKSKQTLHTAHESF